MRRENLHELNIVNKEEARAQMIYVDLEIHEVNQTKTFNTGLRK